MRDINIAAKEPNINAPNPKNGTEINDILEKSTIQNQEITRTGLNNKMQNLLS